MALGRREVEGELEGGIQAFEDEDERDGERQHRPLRRREPEHETEDDGGETDRDLDARAPLRAHEVGEPLAGKAERSDERAARGSHHPRSIPRYRTRLMRVAINREDVEHVAALARLALSEEELERFTGQLSAILEHVSKLKAVDTTGVG